MAIFSLAIFAACASASMLQGPTVGDLRVDQLSSRDALGVGPTPKFSWTIFDDMFARDLIQQSFQIRVTNQYTNQVAWDSGVVSSSKNHLVPYGATNLVSSTPYSWTVTVTTNMGTAVSQPFLFVTGLLTSSEWRGQWITGGGDRKQLRTEFNVTQSFKNAFVHISGLGYFELNVNGVKVGDHNLDVGWTDYRKRVYYVTFDISSYVTAGRNVFAVTLGNSWFACAGGQPGCINTPPQLLVQAVGWSNSEYVTFLTSNTNMWKSAAGPIYYDSLYNGESYDARRETPGWDRPNFVDTTWSPVTIATVTPAIVSPQLFPPIRKVRPFTPRTITLVGPNVYVADFGQNMPGIVRVVIRGCMPGQNITLRHAELLQHPPYGPRDGNIYVGNLRGAKATDVYTCKGGEREIYEPRFTQHGFKYAEISGLTQAPSEDDITAFELHTDVRMTGAFSSSPSTPLLEKIHHAVVWGQKSNLMSVATDCPQRDERRGWTGDAALTSEEAVLNYDMGAFYTNWLNIFADDQNADGSSNDFVPSLGGTNPGAPNWQTAFPTLIWTLLRYRGDTTIVDRMWPAMQRYSAFFEGRYKQTGLKNFFTGYGDWVPPPPAAKANDHLVASFAYLRDLQLLIEMANATGRTAEAQTFSDRLAPLCAEFNTAFYNAAGKHYGSGLQTEQSMGLWLGCVPEADLAGALQFLVNDINANDNHVTTGIIGWKLILEVLSKHNFADVALNLNLQTTYPSFGYMIQGVGNYEPATTVWELWDSDREGPGMNSRNHIMFGTNGGWLYKGLAGIAPSHTIGQSGYKTVLLGPKPSAVNAHNLTAAAATVGTIFGQASVRWEVGSSSSCGTVAEDSVLQLTCPGGNFEKVLFASFGTPSGACGNFAVGSCNAPSSVDAVTKLCVGKSSCAIPATNAIFTEPCFGQLKQLSVQLQCGTSSGAVLVLQAVVPVGAMGEVSVPIVPSLGQSAATFTVTEGGKTVWANGQYVSGVSGVSGARLMQWANGGASVVVQTSNGAYHFIGK